MKSTRLGIVFCLTAIAALFCSRPSLAAPGFVVSATNVTLTSAGTGDSSVTLTASGGYSGSVFVNCNYISGPVPAASSPVCVTTPPRLYQLSSTQTSITTTVPFQPPGSAVPAVQSRNTVPSHSPRQQRDSVLPTAAGLFFAGLGLVGLNRNIRSRHWLSVIFFGLATLTGFSVLSACGGSSTPVLPAGTYSYSIIASDQESHTQTTTIQVIVPANE